MSQERVLWSLSEDGSPLVFPQLGERALSVALVITRSACCSLRAGRGYNLALGGDSWNQPQDFWI